MSHSTRVASFVVFVASLVGPALAFADPPAANNATTTLSPAHDARPVYRFTFTVQRPGDARPTSYTLTLEEHHSGVISVGTNVPLATSAGGPSPRQDVGLSLHMSFEMHGNTPVLSGTAELSAVESGSNAASSVHRLRVDGVAAVPAGRDAQFASLVDYTTHEAFVLTVSATRVL